MTPYDVLKLVWETIDERRASYGDHDAMFAEVARRWEAHAVGPAVDGGFTKVAAACMMAELKLARLAHKWDSDSAIDAIAYLAFAVAFSED